MKLSPSPSLPARLAAAGLLLLMTSACASPPAALPAPPPPPPASASTSADSLWQQIQAASANASCDNSSQCHTIGIGAKACGGPERYLPWSGKQDDGAALKQLVEQHAAALRARDARAAMMSTCSVVSDPGASCQAGRCVLNPGKVGNAPEMR